MNRRLFSPSVENQNYSDFTASLGGAIPECSAKVVIKASSGTSASTQTLTKRAISITDVGHAEVKSLWCQVDPGFLAN